MDRVVISDVRKTFRLKQGQFITVDGRETDEIDVLGGIDLKIRPGEFITLVGPSGSGKSVLLDIVGGLTTATSGNVEFDGTAIRAPLADTSYVFQQYALFPWRTTLANVEYALEVRGIGRQQRKTIARQFLALFGLRDFEDRYPNQLSGGMQQRVAIARALATSPQLLLMDEPFAALDAQTREILQAELLRIWDEIKTTVIFVTHALDEAIYLADRVVVMTARPGRIKAVFDIDLPRPRDADVRASDAFNAYRQQVWEVLRDEVNKAQKDWTVSPALAS
ncbi:ABC transporter ATP-binding protein [Aureimonas fodinaquatilis]|uniref:ABC transporter ATP-binding protein n=1 Tax=Aureimonas fodinaquatilis TaxID=2565783 RepID=A0A5B0E1I5_9HYPH|nr:ABC transporter ATP-binding protein [Aureimonas fodinaquatilis]KAA0972162.1 ABC transporter ATP-binding protein [Aureimonas fodinaquatilis]